MIRYFQISEPFISITFYFSNIPNAISLLSKNIQGDNNELLLFQLCRNQQLCGLFIAICMI